MGERRHAQVLRGIPDRLEVGVRDRAGERATTRLGPPPAADRRLRDDERTTALGAHARHLGDRPLDVAEVDLGHRDQPVRVPVDGVGGPPVPALADALLQIGAPRPAGLDERADEERRVEELHVDATGIAERQPRLGPVERIVAGSLMAVGLERVGHLEVRDEAWRDEVEAVRRLLCLGQLGERRVGEPEHAAGDVHEPCRRPERLGQLRIGARDPVERFVQMAVDVDDPHECPPLRRSSPRQARYAAAWAQPGVGGRGRAPGRRAGAPVW